MDDAAKQILAPLQDMLATGRAGVSQRQRWVAAGTIAALAASGIVATPFADTMLIVVPAYFAMFHAAMFVINLVLASLLFIKGEIEGRGDTTRLGAAYLYVTLIIVTQMASFPGGLMPTQLIGTPQTPLWVWGFWHVGFGLLIIRYAWFARLPEPPRSSLLVSIAGVVALAALLTCIAAFCTDLLPNLITDGHFLVKGGALVLLVPVCGVSLAALASVVNLRATSAERLWLVVGMVASCLEVWLNLQGSARYTIGWYLAKVGSLGASLAVLLSLLHEITLLYGEAAARNALLQRLVRVDGLTGLLNRRGFDELLEREFRVAQRQQQPLALILADIDFFKAFNDHYGHQGGDDCLRRVSEAVMAALWRPGDQAARYGGEEIAVVLPDTDLDGALVIAERVRSVIADLSLPHVGSPIGFVTISAGVCAVLPWHLGQIQAAGKTASELVEAADRALYVSKRQGRNQVNAATTDRLLTTEVE
jgi:diguanylate cyclase (GGDEF)-like protein